jgi:hypothetical protein
MVDILREYALTSLFHHDIMIFLKYLPLVAGKPSDEAYQPTAATATATTVSPYVVIFPTKIRICFAVSDWSPW